MGNECRVPFRPRYIWLKVKVKFNLEQATKAQRGSIHIALLFLTLGARRGGVHAALRPLHPRERGPVPIVQEAGCAPGPVWTGAESLAPTGIRSPDRPACSESLYGLHYFWSTYEQGPVMIKGTATHQHSRQLGWLKKNRF